MHKITHNSSDSESGDGTTSKHFHDTIAKHVSRQLLNLNSEDYDETRTACVAMVSAPFVMRTGTDDEPVTELHPDAMTQRRVTRGSQENTCE